MPFEGGPILMTATGLNESLPRGYPGAATSVLRTGRKHALIGESLVMGVESCLNLLGIIVVGWSGRWPTAG